MNFVESQQYLYSLGNEVAAMKLGLENIRTLLDGLGEPQTKYLKVQVAGTNGKGSVCAFLDSICRKANIKTGLYTSPHLISITERVKIDGVDISEGEFARIATHIRDTAERLLEDGMLEYRPTFFEQMTAIALVAFAEAKVELAILETGLGGRLDATTAANAEIAAITRIDLDHQEYLGETIEEIAAEKAAIIREDTKTVVIGVQQEVVLKILMDRCKKLEIFPQSAQKQFIWSVDFRSGEQTVDEFDVEPSDFEEVLGLKGRHQDENAHIAVMIAGELANDFDLEISEDEMRSGIMNAKHPGRLEYLGRYLFDGAHNIGGANALANFISDHEKRPITMVFGSMSDKSVAEILTVLAPVADKIVLTEPSNSRSLSYDELLEYLPAGFSRERTFASDNVEHAIDIAETVTSNDGIILVTGSLYLVGEVKGILRSEI